MNHLVFWIAEADVLWISSSGLTRLLFGWRGIQAALWPVTFVVRAIVRDPMRDPEPLRPDYLKIHDLERALGMPDTITFHEMLAKSLENGLPVRVTQRPLAELKEGTSPSFDPENP